MDDYYTQFSHPRPLRKVKRLPLLPAAGLPDFSEQDETLKMKPGMLSRDMSSQSDDVEKRQKAYQDLVTVWQQRLQLTSAIATFFASTESSMFGIASKLTPATLIVKVTSAALLGALIIHVFVAFVAFMASFLLVNYRIHETEVEMPRGPPSSGRKVAEKFEKRHSHHRSHSLKGPQVQDLPSSNPRLVQVGFFKGQPPVHLLGRCNDLCVALASFAFILAFIGVCCFGWTVSDPAISVFATVCIALCFLLCIWVFALYDTNSIVIKVDVVQKWQCCPVSDMSNPFNGRFPSGLHVYAKGQEPLPPGVNEEDRPMYEQTKRWERNMVSIMESCPTKTVMAGAAGLGIGAFFSLMSASFAYEDPLLRQQTQAGKNTAQKARDVFKDMGRGMWTTGKGFGKVGALFAGIECVIESYRAKNDIYNSVAAGFLAGGILARHSGPKAAFGGGLAFAAFSAAIDAFLRREPADED